MKAPPKDWPRLSAGLYYDDAAAAIDWLCTAFGFELRLRVDGVGARVEHSQLTYGEALVMVGSIKEAEEHSRAFVSPSTIDGKSTHSLCLFVDDVDAHCERARNAGATIAMEPETHDYGDDYWSDRTYQAVDPEGHRWYFMQRLSGPKA